VVNFTVYLKAGFEISKKNHEIHGNFEVETFIEHL